MTDLPDFQTITPTRTNLENSGFYRDRASEVQGLIQEALPKLIAFIRAADEELQTHQLSSPNQESNSCLLQHHPPEVLGPLLSSTLELPADPRGEQGILSSLESILKYSVNTHAPGFLDKLYSSPCPPGILADLVLSVLNTNVHVYQVSPVLTLIEKHVTKSLAGLFGFTGPRAGGINVQGGSQSNTTSIVIARNTLYPQTKVYGNSWNGLDLCLFTSAHGHYSIEKAAQQCGFGSMAVIAVAVDPVTGRMNPENLEELILKAKQDGKTPFYVNATAGTTVLGSFDPFVEIAEVAKRYNMWMHVDGAWGGTFVISEKLRREKMKGVEMADSIAVNPHKMMGVPLTCSFLLAKDLRHFHNANTLPAGYLFHADTDDEDDGEKAVDDSLQAEDDTPVLDRATEHQREVNGNTISPSTLENGHASTITNGAPINGATPHISSDIDADEWSSPNDLADLTLQCGRRGDALKLFLSWQYYGTSGYTTQIETAYFTTASYFAESISSHRDFLLVSQNPPPCLQVCFYFAPGGKLGFEPNRSENCIQQNDEMRRIAKKNSRITEMIAHRLIQRGFMVDFAPALEGKEWMGKFFRAVVNLGTTRATVDKLIWEVENVGWKVFKELGLER